MIPVDLWLPRHAADTQARQWAADISNDEEWMWLGMFDTPE
jgi:hypothetical protein